MIGVLRIGLDISLVTNGLPSPNLKHFAPVMLRDGIGSISAGVGAGGKGESAFEYEVALKDLGRSAERTRDVSKRRRNMEGESFCCSASPARPRNLVGLYGILEPCQDTLSCRASNTKLNNT